MHNLSHLNKLGCLFLFHFFKTSYIPIFGQVYSMVDKTGAASLTTSLGSSLYRSASFLASSAALFSSSISLLILAFVTELGSISKYRYSTHKYTNLLIWLVWTYFHCMNRIKWDQVLFYACIAPTWICSLYSLHDYGNLHYYFGIKLKNNCFKHMANLWQSHIYAISFCIKICFSYQIG